MRKTVACAALLAVTSLACPCLAQEDGDDGDGRSPVSNPVTGDSGISGMRELVEGRVASNFQAGAALTLDYFRLESDGQGNFGLGSNFDVTQELIEVGLQGGVGLFDVVELGVAVPLFVDARAKIINQATGLQLDSDDTGFGDMVFSAKAGFELEDLLGVSAYIQGQAPTGDDDVGQDVAAATLGAAVTLSLANVFGIHLDVSGKNVETGIQSFQYRVGASITIDAEVIAVKGFFFFDGEEFEGDTGSDVFVTFGVQAFAAKVLFVELSTNVLIAEDSLTANVPGNLDAIGSFGLRFAVGVAFP